LLFNQISDLGHRASISHIEFHLEDQPFLSWILLIYNTVYVPYSQIFDTSFDQDRDVSLKFVNVSLRRSGAVVESPEVPSSSPLSVTNVLCNSYSV